MNYCYIFKFLDLLEGFDSPSQRDQLTKTSERTTGYHKDPKDRVLAEANVRAALELTEHIQGAGSRHQNFTFHS